MITAVEIFDVTHRRRRYVGNTMTPGMNAVTANNLIGADTAAANVSANKQTTCEQ